MLYRLRPLTDVTWCDVPGSTIDLAERHPGAELDRLPWLPAEARPFSVDLLKIALRHGATTASGIALDAVHTADLGRPDELRRTHRAAEDAHAKLRASSAGQLMEQLMPGWTASGEDLDARIRTGTNNAIQEAKEDLAEVLAAPERPDLVEHWTRLGGHLPA